MTGRPEAMNDAQFEAAVSDALDLIPEELARLISNVAVLVEDEPPSDEPDLLGLYEGTPLTERDGWWDAGSLPDRITIYKGPLSRLAADREELIEEIAVTVIHEVAHHFGIHDERLHELGWG
jgi:predicted Zn-dependent protease with MMP-like domain